MLLIAILLGIVEGFTEYVPVSSTGHLILAGHLLGYTGPKAETFEVFIQLGAILAVVGVFWKRFTSLLSTQASSGFSGRRGIWLLIVVSAPGMVFGWLLHDGIKAHLFNTTTVAMGLFAGSLLMLAVEWLHPKTRTTSVDGVTWKQALGIGFFQCLALWPGMSRSSSTIVGGMFLGLSRGVSAEFSFLAAVPIVSAASIYDLYKSWAQLSVRDLGYFAIGFVVSWFCAWLSVRFLLRYLTKHPLTVFAIYRMGIAAAVFLFLR